MELENIIELGYKPVTFENFWECVDAEIAEKSVCPHCNVNMKYRGYTMGNSYRAFSVCSKCGYYEEF